MKIKAANAGALTNYEVLDFLRSRGASKDPTRVIVAVYHYLVETAACNQTREHINEFLEKCKKYGLAKAEVLNIINLRPSTLVETDPIIEQSVERFKERFKKCFKEQLKELVNLAAEVLPAAPTQQKPEEEIEEENEGMADGEITENEGQAAEARQIHKDENEGNADEVQMK